MKRLLALSILVGLAAPGVSMADEAKSTSTPTQTTTATTTATNKTAEAPSLLQRVIEKWARRDTTARPSTTTTTTTTTATAPADNPFVQWWTKTFGFSPTPAQSSQRADQSAMR